MAMSLQKEFGLDEHMLHQSCSLIHIQEEKLAALLEDGDAGRPRFACECAMGRFPHKQFACEVRMCAELTVLKSLAAG